MPKKKYNKFKRNHIKGEWEFDSIVEFDYDFKVVSSKEEKFVPIEKEKRQSGGTHIHVTGDNLFVASQSSFLEKVIVKPIKETNSNAKPTTVKKRSWLEIAAYIAGIIGTIIILYEFIKNYK